jgi:hypothetical protein
MSSKITSRAVNIDRFDEGSPFQIYKPEILRIFDLGNTTVPG